MHINGQLKRRANVLSALGSRLSALGSRLITCIKLTFFTVMVLLSSGVYSATEVYCGFCEYAARCDSCIARGNCSTAFQTFANTSQLFDRVFDYVSADPRRYLSESVGELLVKQNQNTPPVGVCNSQSVLVGESFYNFGDRLVTHYDLNRNYSLKPDCLPKIEPQGAYCVSIFRDDLKISLIGLSEIRPKDTGKTTTATITATVTAGGQPKAGVLVGFGVEVAANSGGHDHHSMLRPKGEISNSTGITDANGQVKIVFEAPHFAGTHYVAATCSGCPNANHEIDVKIPDLLQLTADTSGKGRYTLRGATPTHLENHWFTPAALNNLETLIDTFNDLGWKPVGVNDGSLIWGGSFDVPGAWRVGSNHDEHRTGEEVDISFAVGTNSESIERAYYELCKADTKKMPTTILWHDIPRDQGGKYAPHFHVRLTGVFTKGSAAGKSAPCSKDSDRKNS